MKSNGPVYKSFTAFKDIAVSFKDAGINSLAQQTATKELVKAFSVNLLGWAAAAGPTWSTRGKLSSNARNETTNTEAKRKARKKTAKRKVKNAAFISNCNIISFGDCGEAKNMAKDIKLSDEANRSPFLPSDTGFQIFETEGAF